MTGNSNPPGSLLLGSWGSIHPLNFLPGSHQHPEIAKLGKEKSYEVYTSPNPPKWKNFLQTCWTQPLSQYIHKEGHWEPLKSRLEPPHGRICCTLITGLMFPNDQCWSRSTDLPQKSSNVPHYEKEKSKRFIISQTSRSSTNSPKLFLQAFLASKHRTHLPHNPLFEHT